MLSVELPVLDEPAGSGILGTLLGHSKPFCLRVKFCFEIR